jgi:hypothetical protein
MRGDVIGSGASLDARLVELVNFLGANRRMGDVVDDLVVLAAHGRVDGEAARDALIAEAHRQHFDDDAITTLEHRLRRGLAALADLVETLRDARRGGGR